MQSHDKSLHLGVPLPTPHMATCIYPGCPASPIPGPIEVCRFIGETEGVPRADGTAPAFRALSSKIGVVFEGGGRRSCADCTLRKAYRAASIQKERPPAMAFHLIHPSCRFSTPGHPLRRSHAPRCSRPSISACLRVQATRYG